MWKHVAFTLLLAGPFVPFYTRASTDPEYLSYLTMEDYEFGRATVDPCRGKVVPQGFVCAIFFNLEPPLPEGIASVSGGDYDVIRGITVIIGGMLYTAVYDQPLKWDDKFLEPRRYQGVPARVDRDALFIKLPDGREAKAKIIRREKIKPIATTEIA